METHKRIGWKIRRLRESKKMTLLDICIEIKRKFKISLTHSTLSNWERGNTSPSAIDLYRLSVVLGEDFLEPYRIPKEELK